MASNDVILIADRWYGKRLEHIADGAAVWIVDSPDNQAAIQARAAAGRNGAVIPYRDNFQLSPDEAAAATIGAVVEQNPRIAHVTVIGVALTPVLAAMIAHFGFALEADASPQLRFARSNADAKPAMDTTAALARIIATSGTRETPRVNERTWWFAQRRLLPGWGMPVCWQGWAVLIVYLVLLLVPLQLASRAYGKHPPVSVLAYVFVLTAALIVVVAAKGESSR